MLCRAEFWEDELLELAAGDTADYQGRENVLPNQVELDFLFFRTVNWFVQVRRHTRIR